MIQKKAKSKPKPKPKQWPVEKFLRRRQRQRWVTVGLVVAFLVLASWADYQGWLLYPGDEMRRYHGKSWVVNRVIDGDTITLVVPDGDAEETRVRLWGIDAPETAKPEQGLEAEPFADEAAALVRLLCEGQSVRLSLESHQLRGHYGRIIAHVILPDGSSLNERLLAAGLVRLDERFYHARMERYALINEQGRIARRGMWSIKD